MHNVLVIGDATVDIIVPYPRFINTEKTLVTYSEPVLQGGGTSANTVVALSRLGISTSFIGTVGDDQYGKYIKNDLKNEGVDISNIITEGKLNTVGVFAFIDETGERYLWGWPRIEQSFKVLEEKKVSFQKVYNAKWIHSSGMSLVYDASARSTIIKIFEEAYNLGIPTSFDLNLRVDNGVIDPDYEKAIRKIIKYTTYLLGSGTDEFVYLGENKDWKKNARNFVTENRVVIVRNGKEGSYGFAFNEEVQIPAYEVKVEDTVGAGDIYNAGFIAAKLKGKNLKQSLIAGNLISGYSVTKKGARSSPSTIELKKFSKQYKIKLED